MARAGRGFPIRPHLPKRLAPVTYTASATLTAAHATFAASAAFTKPTYAAAGVLTAAHTTFASAAAFTKPTYAGAGALTAAPATVAATAAFTKPTYAGAGALTAAPAALAGAAAFTKPTYTGAATLTAAPATLAAAATLTEPTYSGAGVLTAAPAAIAAAAAFAEPTYTGTGTLTAAPATLAAVGTFAQSTYVGAVAVTAGPATLSGTTAVAQPTYSGAGAVTAAPAVLSGSATFTEPTYAGAGVLAVGPATLSGGAAFTEPTYAATGALLAAAATLAGAATVTAPTYTGTVALTAAPATLSGAATFALGARTAAAALTVAAARAALVGAVTYADYIPDFPETESVVGYPFTPDHAFGVVVEDLWLGVIDPQREHARPFRVSWLYGFGAVPATEAYAPVHVRDLIVVDAAGAVAFDSRDAAYAEVAWGSSRFVGHWRMADGRTLQAVGRTGPAGGVADHLVADDAWLDERAVGRAADRVTAVTVGGDPLDGVIGLEGGYNVAFEAQADARRRRVIRVVGEAGAGAGRFPGCGETPAPLVRRINRVAPTADGRFFLRTGDCHRFGDAGAATVALVNDCTPCCPCSAYADTYAGLARTWAAWAEASAVLESVRDQHRDNVDRWNAAAAAAAAAPVQTLTRSLGGRRAYVGATYCNTSDCCRTNAEVRVTVVPYSGGLPATLPDPPTVVKAATRDACQAGAEAYAPIVAAAADGWPVLVFRFDTIRRLQPAVIEAQLRRAAVQPGDAAKVVVTVHADPLADGCSGTAPAVAVPAEVLVRWAEAGLGAPDCVGLKAAAVLFEP